MKFDRIFVNKQETRLFPEEQAAWEALKRECQSRQIQVLEQNSWEILKQERSQAKTTGLFLTCSDQGIEAAGGEIPVLAFRNPRFEKNCGKQQLFHTSWLFESIQELSLSFLKQVFDRFHQIPWVIGTTKRCQIRELSLAELSGLYQLQNGYIKEESIFEKKLSFQEYQDYWSAYQKNQYEFYGYGLWALGDLSSGELAGLAGISNPQYEFLNLKDHEIFELSYMIAPKFRRQGYAKEVCSWILQYAARELSADTVSAFIRAENIPSICLAERLGFTRQEAYETAAGVVFRYSNKINE